MAFFEEPTIEDPKDRLEIYDNVWVMYNNTPMKKRIYSRTEVMNHAKNGNDIEYRIVDGICGASDVNAIKFSRDKIFSTKEDLVKSL